MTIKYAEKGVGLHDAIRAAGYFLREENGVWVSSDDKAVQTIIDNYDPLPVAKVARCNAVDALLTKKIGAGCVYNEKVFQIDPISQTKLAGAGAMSMGVVMEAPGAIAWDADFFWIADDNSRVPMTAAECFTFTQTLGQYVSALILTARYIKDACLAAADQNALDAIDIMQGWP